MYECIPVSEYMCVSRLRVHKSHAFSTCWSSSTYSCSTSARTKTQCVSTMKKKQQSEEYPQRTTFECRPRCRGFFKPSPSLNESMAFGGNQVSHNPDTSSNRRPSSLEIMSDRPTSAKKWYNAWDNYAQQKQHRWPDGHDLTLTSC